MTLTQRLFNLINSQHTIEAQQALLVQAAEIVISQQEDIEELEEKVAAFKEKEESVNALKLEHLRQMEGMAAAWLINLEDPDTEIRERIALLAQTLGEDIARIEEHVL